MYCACRLQVLNGRPSVFNACSFQSARFWESGAKANVYASLLCCSFPASQFKTARKSLAHTYPTYNLPFDQTSQITQLNITCLCIFQALYPFSTSTSGQVTAILPSLANKAPPAFDHSSVNNAYGNLRSITTRYTSVTLTHPQWPAAPTPCNPTLPPQSPKAPKPPLPPTAT